jgi:hypothetical protein
MRISYEAIYQALYVQGRGALRRELTACLRTGRALRVPQAPGRASRQEARQPPDHDQPASRRGRRPRRAWTLGRRPHPGAGQVRDRHPGRAHHPVHDAAAPAPHRRPWRPQSQQLARAGRPRRPRPSGTPSPQRSPRCPNSSASQSPGIRRRNGPAPPGCASTPASRSTSATRTAPGSAPPTTTATACHANTSPSAPTSADTAQRPRRHRHRAQQPSPQDPGAGEPQPRPSTNSSCRSTRRGCEHPLNPSSTPPPSTSTWRCSTTAAPPFGPGLSQPH